MMSNEADIAIVGGGAAGLATAIFTARRLPDRRVIVLDGAKRLGAKLLISGGGRCNVTNDAVTAGDFCGGSHNVVRRVLAAFTVEQTIAFFRELGVALHVEAGGKMFPATNKARTVLGALVAETCRLGVRILTGHRVVAIRRCDSGFDIGIGRNSTEHAAPHSITASRVVLATGGQSVAKTGSDGTGYRLAQSLGHSLVPPIPALVPLVLDGDFHEPLSGVAQDVEVVVRVEGSKPARLLGALLWTHFGASGPVVLNASRHWHAARQANRAVTVSLNFLPGADFESADGRLVELAASQPRAAVHNALAALVPTRVAAAIATRLGIDPQLSIGQLPRDQRRRLVHALIDWPLPVHSSRGFDYAEVTAGGVPLDEVNPSTMESRRCPGLYLVGEILDIDGRIGGFNFQWAWSSAYVAATRLR
jgi:hypothetical protein